MARRACDGAGLLGAFRAAAARLEVSVDEVNALNVFPVPDGDTGSNMMATVRAALAEAEALGPSASAERVASAAAFGALMGARGNSGVITSQILRG
ncbi:MAG TPA: DAK2 domain-containing protein, partial [Candidatus Deferrimicrobiaceae bacterium]|nr:DAK2 domain-containing protein [Candidatus Deferrimicrobiaceae bacterium]